MSHVCTLAVGAFRIFGVKRDKLCKQSLKIGNNFIFTFWGKIPYFIEKSHNRRFDSPIYPKVYLKMLFHMKFY